MNTDEFAGKVEWEGGILESLEYGLKSTDIDDDPELAEAWKKLEDAYAALQPLVRGVEALLPDTAW